MAYCNNCGTSIQAGVKYCSNCGFEHHEAPGYTTQNHNAGGGPAYQHTAAIDNHMVKAILTTLFCCLPFGIAAIVNASKVDSLKSNGDIDGAMEYSKKADEMANLAFGIGLVVLVIYFFGMLLGA